MIKYDIEKVCDLNASHHRKKYPWEQMEVGDSISPENAKSAVISARYYSKKHCSNEKKFIVRGEKVIRVL